MNKKPILNVYHPRLTAGLWLIGMLIVCILGIQALTKDWLETGFLALLPINEQQPEIAKATQQHNELLNRKVVWLAGAETSQEAIGYAQKLKQQLEQSKLFNKVVLEFPQQQYIKQYQQLFPYRYQLLDAQTQAILAANPEQLIKQNLEILNSPIGQMQAADLERDPSLIFSRYFSAQNPIKLNLEQGIVVLSDQLRYWAVLLTDLQDERLQLDKLETLSSLVDSATEQAKTAGGELLVSGMALFTAHGAQSAKQEISTVGIGSSLGIIVLLWATFRSVRPLLLSSLAIGSGLLAALVICVLFFGKIHILTLVFGASLIGVADDYAQHFLCDSFGEKDWNPRKGLKFILPGLSLGLISNLLSYAGLGFSPFPGLQEVALFSAMGLLVAWLTVVLLFPLLLTGFTFDHEPGILKLTTYWEQHWPLWVNKNRRWLGLMLTVFIAAGLWMLKPQDDVRLLQSPPAELIRTADKIRQLFPMSPDNQFFLVSGKGQADWHQNEQTLLKRLDALKQQKALTAYQGLSSYWPDADQQQQNYRLLKHKLYDSGLLERYMTDLGFDKTAVQAEYKQFAAAEQNTLALPSWLATADETKQQLWLGCDDGRCQSTVALIGINDINALKAVQDLSGVVWVDQVESVSSLFARYRIRASGLLLAAFFLASLGLGYKFGWRNGVTIMSVPAVSLAVSLAMLGWFDQLFSLFNLFALLLVLGIGVDYGLFFFMAGDRRASTSLGVTLSALTTLLAFGLLAISSTEIVHAFGFTVTAGIVTALLCAPLIGFRNIKIMTNHNKGEIIIIGAGPSGSIAGALLQNQGFKVTILERQLFPRFSIGESLLPQCMEFIKQAGMMDALVNAGFQYKNGASFVYQDQQTEFSFEDKFSPGMGTTFQVQRGRFDKLLADEAVRMGVDIQWQMEVLAADFSADRPELTVRNSLGEVMTCRADFVLDASGFGRILPKLLDLESPSGFPVRQALFGHIEDRIGEGQFDRNKIRITVHPQHKDVWYWLIPFSNGRSSVGVVAEPEFLQGWDSNDQALQDIIRQDPSLTALLKDAVFDEKINTIVGYSANVKSLYGKGYALLGNAGEFLDPVFSSGVTIAMKSASLAADVLVRQFNNETVDWQQDYAGPLQRGVNTFRVFVDAWYDGRFQDVIFHPRQQPEVKAMISSILAGYAWDENNPYVKNARPRLDTLVELCR